MASNTSLQRRSDLDWLRVIAVLLLVPFHAALIFLPDPALVAYVKDSQPSAALAPLVDFLSRWHSRCSSSSRVQPPGTHSGAAPPGSISLSGCGACSYPSSSGCSRWFRSW